MTNQPKPKKLNKSKADPFDKVTTTTLSTALQLCGLHISTHVVDRIIDVVELVAKKGDGVTINDLCKLQEEWGPLHS